MTNQPTSPTMSKVRLKPGHSHLIDLPVLRGWDEVSDLFELINGRGWIAGSFAAWMCSPVDTLILPNDIDIFASTPDNAWAITQDICKARDWIWDVSPIAYTLTPNPLWLWDSGKQDNRKTIQVIVTNPAWMKLDPAGGNTLLPASISTILNSFDLDICRAALCEPELIIGDAQAGKLQARIMNVQNPVKNVERIIKYAKRGVKFESGELVKLFIAFDKLLPPDKERAIGRYATRTGTDNSWNFEVEFDERFFAVYPPDPDNDF